MKLLEIKNNLVKLSYTENETPVLGRFIVLSSETKSYVAQFVNLKSDTVSTFAIAKLLFTFSGDGVVDNYDGSIPSINSELSLLPPSELLGLLPIENPLKIGNLAQQEDMLVIDASVFERNFTVFVENDSNKTTFISNSIRQLFQMREKSVIIDDSNLFEDYEKIVFGRDFKLPLNAEMIDYLFEHELTEVDASTKAIIQDIFYAVQEYIKSLDFEFLPIDNFVDVVTNQYRATQMPELALLKNKLLKYRDSNVFANSKEEVFALKVKLDEKNCSIIDIKDIPETLQNEVLTFVHGVLGSFDKYVYFFVPLNDENSDKKLLKRFLNHNHVFTTMLVSSSYKYAEELKQHAQNIVLFAPNTVNHDFATYNTFLNKLNPDECVVCGKLTQGIPFIVSLTDLELDLTKEDVLGERYQFIPVVEDLQLVKVDEFGNKIPVTMPKAEETTKEPEEKDSTEPNETVVASIPVIEQAPIEVVDEEVEQQSEQSLGIPEPSAITVDETPSGEVLDIEEDDLDLSDTESEFVESDMIVEDDLQQDLPPQEDNFVNMQEPENLSLGEEEPTIESSVIEPAGNLLDDELPLEEDDLDAILSEEPNPEDDFDVTQIEDEQNATQGYPAYTEDSLTEDDLNFLEDNQSNSQAEPFDVDQAVDSMFEEDETNQEPPVVPVYPTEEQNDGTEIDYKQGDRVTHHRYGRGVVEKIIKYGNKTLCSISFENVGRRLLDPTITDLKKLTF